jgi:hypothetical protein
MSRSISTWIEVPQTAPADGAARPRRPRRRAVRLTIATAPESRAQRDAVVREPLAPAPAARVRIRERRGAEHGVAVERAAQPAM